MEVWDGEGVVPLGTPQQRALLAVLALSPGEVVSRDRIIDELWGESPPETAAKLVQVYVSRLRKALEPDRPVGGGEVLVTRSPGYVLLADADQTDVGRFEGLVARGREAMAGGAPGKAADLLRQGLALWRGPPLADFALEPFAQAEAGRLEELRTAAIEDRIDAELAQGGVDVVGELETLIARNPFRERLRGQLMLALYRAGRQSEALAAYRDARAALVEEIGVEPGPGLRELERAILAQDPSLDAPQPPRQATRTGARSEVEPATGTRPDPDALIGRRHELDLLLGRVEGALANRGGTILIAGEAGIGKSRLLEELASRARESGMRVLRGRCWEAGGAPAYWPWVEALRGYVSARDPAALRDELGPRAAELATILPELRSPGGDERPLPPQDADAARFRLFDALASFLTETAADEPLMVVLDDLHAADEPSLSLLHFLAGRISSARLVVVGAYRDTELGPDTALAATLAELAREGSAGQLTLRGLTEAEVGSLIESRAGARAPERSVAAIHRGTEGNPLFVSEVARLLSSEGQLDLAGAGDAALPIPPSVREVIGRRLRLLSNDCRETLALASVLGREFEFGPLAQVSERTDEELLDSLEEALGALVIAEVPGAPDRFRFAHVLIRDTLYRELVGPRRVRFHRDVGEALETLYADDPDPHLAELAHHFAAAGTAADPAKAVEYARRAGDRAIRLLAYEEAVRLYAVALEALGPEGAETAPTRCELLLELGSAQARAGTEDDAKASYLRAAKLAMSAGLPELMARAAVGYGGRFLWPRAVTDERLVPLLEDALDAIDDSDTVLRVQLLSRLAGAIRGEPSRERRERISNQAVEAARRIGDPAVVAYALDGRGTALLGPDDGARTLTDAEELISLAESIGDGERLFGGHDLKFWTSWTVGDLDGRAAGLASLTRVAEELKQPSQLWNAAAAQAAVALAEGSFSEAEELIDRAAMLGEGAQSWNADTSQRYQLMLLRSELGRLDELERSAVGPASAHPSPLAHQCVTAYVDARVGRAEQAKAVLEQLRGRDLSRWHVDEEWLFGLFLLADAGVRVGDADSAAQLYDLLLPYGSLNAVAIAECGLDSISRALGALASMLGRFDLAERHFAEALRMNESMAAAPGVAHVEHEHARMLVARGGEGDSEAALELARSARAAYRELGMGSFATEATEVLRSLGAEVAE
jgi:DNA-binding SARP family transcriptional activator